MEIYKDKKISKGVYFLRVFLSFGVLFFSSIFLILNAVQVEEVQGRYLILASLVSAVMLFVLSPSRWDVILHPPKTILFFLLFCGYYISCYLIDAAKIGGDLNLRELIFGINGGILFGFFLGQLIALSISEIRLFIISNERDILSITKLLTYAYLLVVLSFICINFLGNLDSIGGAQFLIEDWGGAYQRSGDYSLIVLIVIAAIAFSVDELQAYWGRGGSILVLSGFVITSVILVLMTQFMGSNAGFVTTLGFLIATLSVLHAVKSYKSKKDIKINIESCLFFIKKVVIFQFFLALVLFITVALLMNFFEISFNQFRIFGFDTGEITSIALRLEILSGNFFTHFSYSPIFGNTQVDLITTGPGTYAHSLLAVLSHLGIVGFMLFLLMLYKIFNTFKFKIQSSSSLNLVDDEKIFSIFKIVGLIFIISFAFAATFYTWLPFWFAIGFLGIGISTPHRCGKFQAI